MEGTIRRIVDKFVDIVIQPVLDEMNQVGKPSLPWNFDETSTRITHIMEWGR
eukprot:CAMPEP_0202472146 /NCGR_PEP_ID=MMETSP1360-20130828/86831_1 /ASSEMBLY_ACC=CAM_ASM_000848 /TAXON_ID=515479 /ORGANISM="Licmophora paradoxa, Strain CCMP2313" /LENGTH=51 /DNA_ID=CAMNT_0049098493 /DNA_START=1 /DNA_END=153 /DNA_ORIENTATION=+